MITSRSGTPIVADTEGLARLARDLRAAAPAAWKAYRTSALIAAKPILADAQARAGYSTRIPQSGRIRVTGAGNVRIIFGGPEAPDAAPIENKGKGFVRHPTFSPRPDMPERTGWTDLNSHPPFAAPALDAHREGTAQAIGDGVARAVEIALRG